VLIGVVAAVAAGLAVYFLTLSVGQSAQQTSAGPVATPQVPTVEVVVATQDIEANTIVTNSMLVMAPYPADLVSDDTVKNMADVVGKNTTSKVFGGQPLLNRQFFDADQREGPSVVVPQGKVLVAFPSTDMLNSTGAVTKGDRVDILLTIPLSGTARLDAGAETTTQVASGARAIVSQATLQNVEVYSTGLWSPPDAVEGHNQTVKVITFLVDHQEALILKFVKDSGGTIDLVVRSLLDDKPVETDPVNLDYLVDLYRFIGLPRNNP
jgi:pilus assembly protein CpaB